MTDNGSAYRSTIHALACRALGVRHLRTRPYRPRTNGKAERFIRTLLAGWAYGAIYATSRERTAALDGWLWTYNHRRPHGALSHKPPIARLNELNNLPGSYTWSTAVLIPSRRSCSSSTAPRRCAGPSRRLRRARARPALPPPQGTKRPRSPARARARDGPGAAPRGVGARTTRDRRAAARAAGLRARPARGPTPPARCARAWTRR